MISPELESRLRKNGWEGEITTDRLLEALPCAIEIDNLVCCFSISIWSYNTKNKPKSYRCYYESYDNFGVVETECGNITEALSILYCELKEKNLI